MTLGTLSGLIGRALSAALFGGFVGAAALLLMIASRADGADLEGALIYAAVVIATHMLLLVPLIFILLATVGMGLAFLSSRLGHHFILYTATGIVLGCLVAWCWHDPDARGHIPVLWWPIAPLSITGAFAAWWRQVRNFDRDRK